MNKFKKQDKYGEIKERLDGSIEKFRKILNKDHEIEKQRNIEDSGGGENHSGMEKPQESEIINTIENVKYNKNHGEIDS